MIKFKDLYAMTFGNILYVYVQGKGCVYELDVAHDGIPEDLEEANVITINAVDKFYIEVWVKRR